MHRSGESHPCEVCEAVFRSAAGLRYHRWKFHRTGSNGPQRDDPENWFEKPFMCGYCSHTSGLAGNLKKHIANMHKDMPMKVIDLRKARKEAKKAAHARNAYDSHEGVERETPEVGDVDGDSLGDSLDGQPNIVASAASTMRQNDAAGAGLTGDHPMADAYRMNVNERMDNNSEMRMRMEMKDRMDGERLKELNELNERVEMERMREFERMEMERMREMSERMETGGVDMRRIDMIVNQIANRIHT